MKDGQVKALYQSTFFIAFFLLTLFFSVLFIGLEHVFASIFGWRLNFGRSGIIGGASVLYMIGAHHIALRRCRRLGVSKDSQTVETVQNLRKVGADFPLPPVEIWWPKTFAGRLGYFAFFAFMGATCALLLHYSTISTGERWMLIFGSGFFLYLALAPLLTCRVPSVRADHEAISCKRNFFNRVVPWNKVDHCDIVTTRHVVGKVGNVYAVLKDANGKTLMTINPSFFSGASIEEGDELMNFIRQRLHGTA